MSILCGTDFSPGAWSAVESAGLLAAGMGVTLHLAHTLAHTASQTVEDRGQAIALSARQRLAANADRLHRITSNVQVHLTVGPPEEALTQLAEHVSAQLVVVSAFGDRKAEEAQLGSHAEKVAASTVLPVLVVRDASGFRAWSRGDRPLKIVLARKLSQTADPATQQVLRLAEFGACEAVVVHLYDASHERDRLGLSSAHEMERDPIAAATLERELWSSSEEALAKLSPRLRIAPRAGTRARQLVSIAREERADLLIVGAHSGPERPWARSTSLGVLRDAHCSVMCVPTLALSPTAGPRRVRNVLMATDFSPLGNAALELARSVLEPAGTLHLTHVLPCHADSVLQRDIFHPTPAAHRNEAAARDKLSALAARIPGVEVEVHVLESAEVARAICQAAERLGADIVCLGSHGNSAFANALLGSTATSVLHRSRRPVLLNR